MDGTMNGPRVETIWGELSGPLKGFLRKRVGDDQAADDLLQDVFLKIHMRLDTLEDPARLQSWVYQIARNAVSDYYRARGTLPLEEQDLIGGEEADAEEQGTNELEEELAGSVKAMMDCLPEVYREALWLDTFEGVGQAEIAARLGISLSGAKSRVQRARAQLRQMLFECCHFQFDRRGAVIDYRPRTRCECCQEGCGAGQEACGGREKERTC